MQLKLTNKLFLLLEKLRQYRSQFQINGFIALIVFAFPIANEVPLEM